MLQQSKLLLFLASICLTMSCPIWRCARKDDIEVPGYCYYLDQDHIVAGPWCVENSKGCSIISYFNEETTLKCPALPGADIYKGQDDIDAVLGKKSEWQDIVAAAKAADANAAAVAASDYGSNGGRLLTTQERELKNIKEHVLTDQLKHELCKGKDLWHLFQCDNFCVQKTKCDKRRKLEEGQERELSNKQCYECDWTSFKESKLQKKDGKQYWNKCDYDNECSSGDCDCVISTDNRGRCTTSVYEEVYEDFWKFLCEETDEPDYEEEVCEKYIQVDLGHYIRAVSEVESDLKCLTKFSEISELTSLSARVAVKSGGHGFLIFFIILLIAGCGAGGFYYYKNYYNKEERPVSESQSGAKLKEKQNVQGGYGQFN